MTKTEFRKRIGKWDISLLSISSTGACVYIETRDPFICKLPIYSPSQGDFAEQLARLEKEHAKFQRWLDEIRAEKDKAPGGKDAT